MNIYWNFAFLFLIFQPVLILSEGIEANFSLSQMSLLLYKMDEFLASKCIMNKSAFMKMRMFILSADVEVHFSLSQMSLFLNKMDGFLASKLFG
uniref:Secreted protein n=1 Tax=Globodera rostochiensis TaxID=31243 RepID=A0A914HP58_GLORO